MIFVTGGTGLLGSHLLVELSQNNKTIRAIYRCEKKKESVRLLFKYYIAKDYNLFFNRIEFLKFTCELYKTYTFLKDCTYSKSVGQNFLNLMIRNLV